MAARAALCCAVVLVCALGAAAQWHPEPNDFVRWMAQGGFVVHGQESLPELRQKVLQRAAQFSTNFLNQRQEEPRSKEFPYFAWIPPYVTSIVPDAAAVSWSAPCFRDNTASAATVAGNWTITLTFANASSLLCQDDYMIATVEGVKLESVATHGTRTLQWTVNPAKISAAELWDIRTKGFRVFRFVDGPVQTISDLLSTLVMFEPELTKGVSDFAAKANLDFLNKYRGVDMKTRTTTTVEIDDSLIHSGDFFGVIRLDGLDPMLAWAMGSTTGHTTVALRDPATGELYVTESTAKDSYWPVNGIQRTPYKQWLATAEAAGYHVVWAPLKPEYRAKFNHTAAWERFLSLEGFDYGYHALLWGWLDTLKDNYPCLPPDYTQCLQWQHVEILFGVIDHLVPSIGELIFDQGFNVRLGTSGLKAADLFYTAFQRGIAPNTIPSMVERDSFVYNTTRNGKPTPGPAMVCCVFVCNIWKAGGLFKEIGDQINCGELTNYDDYSLTLFDPKAARPAQCVSADPDNANCQLMGQYTLTLNDYGTKDMYAHYAEKCPSLPPLYKRPAGC